MYKLALICCLHMLLLALLLVLLPPPHFGPARHASSAAPSAPAARHGDSESMIDECPADTQAGRPRRRGSTGSCLVLLVLIPSRRFTGTGKFKLRVRGAAPLAHWRPISATSEKTKTLVAAWLPW